MRIIKALKHLFYLNIEQYKYTRNLGFLCKSIVLQSIGALNLFTKRSQQYRWKVAERFNKPYLFTTGFGTYLCHTENAWSVMQKNYEPEIREVILNNSKKNANEREKYFINIGTHIGRWAIDIVKNHNYKAICFEPSPETFKYLKINTILSNVDKDIQLYNFGLGDKESMADFEYMPSHDGSSRVVQKIDINSEFASIIQIPIKKFDDLDIDKDILSKTRLIIMDVEGFEPFVLKGMEESLKHFSNIDIIIEIFDSHEKKQETIEFMKNLGYQAKQIEKDNYLFSKK